MIPILLFPNRSSETGRRSDTSAECRLFAPVTTVTSEFKVRRSAESPLRSPGKLWPRWGFRIAGAACLLLFGAARPLSAADTEQIDGFRDTPMIPGTKWHLHDPDRPQPRVVTPGATFSQGAPPPSDAEVLFDGTDLSKWENMRGQAAHWKVGNGYVETAARGGGIRTRGQWADFQLHVEWAAPNPPHGTGQGRGNSGILINGMYEVQVLDSYHAKTYPDGQAGAIYGQSPPLVNASKPPGEWQTYDIIFESPRWDGKGELVKKACVTVLHNGVVVQNHYEFSGSTDGISAAVPWRTLAKYVGPHPPEVFVELQDHNNPVRYRNIWIRKLGERDTP